MGDDRGDSTVTTLRVSDGKSVGTFAVAASPTGIAFDGTNIWVAGISNATELRASDGKLLGTFAGGGACVAFDGANLWFTSGGPNITKIRARDGALLGTFSTGGDLSLGVVFDGQFIWVANFGLGGSSTNVSKLNLDGSIAATYVITGGPTGIAFDGANIWVGLGSNGVAKM